MKYPIRMYGDPVLREKATPVATVDDDVRQLAADLIETMVAERGVGLAAQQVGQNVAICVVSVPQEYDVDEANNRLNPDVDMPLVLINPAIVDSSSTVEKAEEGCLSFPDITGPVPRPTEVTVRFVARHGVEQELRAKGFVARVIQHEVDHLNGVLFIDRMSQVKRIALSGQLKRLKKETRARVGSV